ncbi:MAG TPA: cyclic-phosphate processing receiver domain-containing protein [Planctomycetota bacterium]|nr:cyclic-phosphate processing receiver domain-containing protein [Planctomycetota bacterium]
MTASLAPEVRVSVVFFERAPLMIDWLKSHLADCALISLDHDLVATSPGEDWGKGAHVAEFLGAQTPCCPVIVHTANYLEAPLMLYWLERGAWRVERVAPFNDLEWIDIEWAPTVRRLLAAQNG